MQAIILVSAAVEDARREAERLLAPYMNTPTTFGQWSDIEWGDPYRLIDVFPGFDPLDPPEVVVTGDGEWHKLEGMLDVERFLNEARQTAVAVPCELLG